MAIFHLGRSPPLPLHLSLSPSPAPPFVSVFLYPPPPPSPRAFQVIATFITKTVPVYLAGLPIPTTMDEVTQMDAAGVVALGPLFMAVFFHTVIPLPLL